MGHDLTDMATVSGFRFVRSRELRGLNHAVKIDGAQDIYVSPALFDLLTSDDGDAVLRGLKVRIVAGPELRPRRAGRKGSTLLWGGPNG